MMQAPFTPAPGKWALALLPIFFLAGCATTEPSAPVTSQVSSVDQQIAALDARLEAGLRTALSTANEAKFLAARQDARLNDLEGRLTGQAQQLDALRADIAHQGKENTQSLAQLRGDLQAAKQAQAEELSNRLAQNQARTDARLKESDAALNARLEQMEKRLAEVARMAEDALAALGLGPRKIYGKVVHSVALTDDKTLFPINSPDLGEQDIAKLKAVADYVKKLDVNYHIGIHGHTDGLGSDDYNYELGKARAEVVKNYLNEKLGIPLLRMSVISHGATDVSAYRVGANRRIVVEVLQ